MTRVELAVVNGTVVGSSGRRQANLGVREGKIVYVGTEPIEAEHEIDALGLVVLPGGIDTHVHLMDPGSPDREDFPTGTAAAARAGVTTIIEHTHGAPVRSAQDLAEKVAYLGGRSHVDFALAAHAWPGEHDAVNQLWRAGVAFFKVFTCTTHGIPGHDAAALLRHFRSTSAVGARSLVHCEDDSITADAERVLRGLGRVDGGILSEWRSRIAELTAVSVVSLLARATSAKVTIAHVSHPEVCDYILAERARGADIAAEACPQYFYLREDEVHE
ncbi:MAG TPA: amidohydrolase family protein, partial [Propionibacteriaceae bacterium]